MKKKTFFRLKIFALSLLLAEAMMLLVLLLAQTGASAEVGGNQGSSHKGTTRGAGYSSQGAPGSSDDQDAKNSFYGRHWGEDADLLDPQDDGFPDEFGGTGPSGDGKDAGQDGSSHVADQAWGGFPHFFPGFSGPGGSQGGEDASGQSPDDHSSGDQSADGQSSGGDDFGTHGEGGSDFTGELNNFGETNIADGTDDDDKGGDVEGQPGGKPDGQSGPKPPIRTANLAPTSVPEPISVSLLIAGLAGATLVRRRKR